MLSACERWLTEGLNFHLDPRRYDEWCDAFGLDRWPTTVSVHLARASLFEEAVLEETETTVTKRLSDGSIEQDNKGSHKSIPHVVRPAVTSRAEWGRLKEWWQVEAPLPGADVPEVFEVLQQARESDQAEGIADFLDK